jgi:hypothetical protein
VNTAVRISSCSTKSLIAVTRGFTASPHPVRELGWDTGVWVTQWFTQHRLPWRRAYACTACCTAEVCTTCNIHQYTHQPMPTTTSCKFLRRPHHPSQHPPRAYAAQASHSLDQCRHVSIQYCLCHTQYTPHRSLPRRYSLVQSPPVNRTLPHQPVSPDTSPATPKMLHTVCRLGSP